MKKAPKRPSHKWQRITTKSTLKQSHSRPACM